MARGKTEIEIGTRFNRLVTISETYLKNNGKRNRSYVNCICDCGTNKDICVDRLLCKDTTSCGCYSKEVKFKHGYQGNPETKKIYGVWRGTKTRCYNKKNKSYPNYGGRGIKVCDEWLNNSGAFVEWALSNGYKEGLQLDRINPNGNYEPKNCRFITNKKNQNNKQFHYCGLCLEKIRQDEPDNTALQLSFDF